MKKDHIFLLIFFLLAFGVAIAAASTSGFSSSEEITVNISSISFHGKYATMGIVNSESYNVIDAYFVSDKPSVYTIEKGDSNYVVLLPRTGNRFYQIQKLVLTEEMYAKAF